MAYRRPAVTVIQEFVGRVPALATFSLPSVAVGPAFQLVFDDALGTYGNLQQVYAYASLLGGAIVDLEELAEDEPYVAAKLPISVALKDAIVQVVSEQTSGTGSGQAFSDLTALIFERTQAGDLVVVKEALNVSILPLQNDGETVDTAGLRDRLTAGTAGQFANVKAGDTVAVSAGTNTNIGSYTVLVKISDDVIKLNADVNDGVGPSSDVAYTITGNRGTLNQGQYRIKEKTDDNNLVLESPLAEAEAPITYEIHREVAEIDLSRVSALPGNGFLASASGITLPAGLTYTDDVPETYDILSGDVVASYRALRTDMAADVREFGRLSDVEAFFGVDQITPANPLAFALSIMLQNTVTPVNGLGLNSNGLADESLAYTSALDVLALTNMYALVPLTQNPVVHQLFKTHVEQMSQPEKRAERVAIVNRTLKTVETVKEEATTSTAEAGARIIVNTQVDGAHDGSDLDRLTDATPDQFLNVQAGDTVVIQSGTGVTPGSYPVQTVVSANALDLGTAFAAAGPAASDIQYYIIRRDGVGANGQTFYDRNAQFITDGVAPGYYVKVSTPSGVVGRHRIASVDSEKQLTLDQIPGVATLTVGITYEVERDMSRTEQADFVKGYSSSLGSRRVVNLWPDTLEVPVGQVVEDLPGFYGCCAIGAITTGLPTQQGFTNLTISGFLGLEHSTKYFTEEQLDIIADGGTLILGQEGPEQPLFIRHQLTTDRSAIKFQEYSVTKNVDFIAKSIRDAYKGFPGVYNIVDTTLDELRGTAKAVITFLKDDTRLPRIGGVIRSGTLTQIEESATQIDTVKMRFKFNIPIPLNDLDITIEV